VSADIGEARGIGHAGGLAGLGVGPALALLEFDGVVVEELVDGDGWEHEGVRLVTGDWGLVAVTRSSKIEIRSGLRG